MDDLCTFKWRSDLGNETHGNGEDTVTGADITHCRVALPWSPRALS
jgi:hypothetical protein